MKSKIKVMIADTDAELSGQLYHFLNQQPEVEVIGVFRDGCSTVMGMREQRPDILLMDLILPKMDGLDVLDNVMKMDHAPDVIVTSLLDHSNMIGCALSLGASYYICKPYNLDNVYQRILQVRNFHSISSINSVKTNVEILEESKEKVRYLNEYSLETEVTTIIRELGIPAHIKGYQYIRDGIILAYNDANMLNYITKFLYPSIAKKYKTTSSSVERAIRHAIGVAWERGNSNALGQLYGYAISENHLRPTNSEFLAMIVDKLRLSYRQHA